MTGDKLDEVRAERIAECDWDRKLAGHRPLENVGGAVDCYTSVSNADKMRDFAELIERDMGANCFSAR
jgi:hypothetical protein